MPHFCTSKMTWLQTDWFASKTAIRINQLRPGQLQAAYQYINQFFEAHLLDPQNNPVCVPFNCPHPWPPVLGPLWLACGMDEEDAAKFLGNLYCRHAIARKEKWWSFPDARLEWKPRRYIAEVHLLNAVHKLF